MREVRIIDCAVVTLPSPVDRVRRAMIERGLNDEEFVVVPLARKPYLHVTSLSSRSGFATRTETDLLALGPDASFSTLAPFEGTRPIRHHRVAVEEL
jgi:DNA-binding transcriptional LysR family regulator